ncbi:MAG: hypothetical protein ABIP54_00425 [Candidatus Andersenbacteria bacterium]
MMPKGANLILIKSWKEGDDYMIETLLQQMNPLDHLYLLEYPIQHELKPRMLRTFLTVCEIKRIESTSFKEIASICSKKLSDVNTYDDISKHKAYAKNLKYLCRARIRDNMHFCRSTVIALLGCCQKRRVYKGGLRDVSTAMAKRVWTTRQRDAWGK